jgi:CubicO group peptidase (beta-lactamase class C family)
MIKKLLAAAALAASCGGTAVPPASPAPEPSRPATVRVVTVPRAPHPVPVIAPLPAARPEEVGMAPSLPATIDSIMNAAIADRAAPGAAIAIGRHGRIVKLQGYGSLDYRPGFAAVTDSSIYDLASLTKVVATTTAAMLLFEQ